MHGDSDSIVKRLERPDEVRRFEKGTFEIVSLGAMTVGRATYEPGWRWSEHVGAATGTRLCDVEHVGHVLEGRAGVSFPDGRIVELSAGDFFFIGPGHDSWVIGDERYVSLHFTGADRYAAR